TAEGGGGNGESALAKLGGNGDLTEGRLLDRQRYDGILDLVRHAVLQHRFLAADFLQGQFAALVIELLELIEAVAAVAHHFAGLDDVVLPVGVPHAGDFRAAGILVSPRGVLQGAEARAVAAPTAPRPASARDSPWGPGHLCQVKF